MNDLEMADLAIDESIIRLEDGLDPLFGVSREDFQINEEFDHAMCSNWKDSEWECEDGEEYGLSIDSVA